MTEEETTNGRTIRRVWEQMPSLAVLGIAVAVLVIAALVLALVEWQSADGKVSRLQRDANLRATALKAADTLGVDFGSYDYRNLRGPTAPWTVIEAHATPKFRSDYQVTSSRLESTIVAYKATASATVTLSAVSSVTPAKAVVLIVMAQKITNSTQKSGPQSQQFIVVMSLVHQKGQWLVDNVQAST